MRAFPFLLLLYLVLASPSAAAQSKWIPLDAGTTADLYAVSFPTYTTGYAVGAGGTVVRATHEGSFWTDVSVPGAGDLWGVHAFDAETAVVVGDGGAIYRTTDGGVTWTPVPSGTTEALRSVAFDGMLGVAGGTSQTILRSEDAGASWSVVQDGFFGGGFYGADVYGSTVLVAGQNSILQPLVGYSTDGGVTYDFSAFYLESNEGQLQGLALFDEARALAVGRTFDFRGALARSDDGGATWSVTLVPEALNGIATSSKVQEAFAVGADGAIYELNEGGWSMDPSGVASTLYGVDHEYFIVYAVGASGTVLQRYLRSTPAIAEGPSADDLALEQIGPNPFRHSTAVRYELAEAGLVTLRLFDVLGREVVLLASGMQAAGPHTVRIDGRGLSAGAYVCVLQTGGAQVSRVLMAQ